MKNFYVPSRKPFTDLFLPEQMEQQVSSDGEEQSSGQRTLVQFKFGLPNEFWGKKSL